MTAEAVGTEQEHTRPTLDECVNDSHPDSALQGRLCVGETVDNHGALGEASADVRAESQR